MSIACDDLRHGSTRGYDAGCRDSCCRAANARRAKRYRLARLHGGVSRPAVGSQRRIQALMCLGWSATDIAVAAGWAHRNRVLIILKGQKRKPCRYVEAKTHDTIAAVYEQLSMRLPAPSMYVTRTKNLAAKKGWLPPLAWDDIDNDPTPSLACGQRRPAQDDIDHAVVERFLAGEDTLETTFAERVEILRRWMVRGGSELSLCTRTGWKQGRYQQPPTERMTA